MYLRNKKILITGGLGGIGSKIIKRLIELKAQIIVIDINKDISSSFKKKYPSHQFYVCDISNNKNLNNTLLKIFKKNNKIDILINNVGILHNEPIVTMSNKGFKSHSFSSWKKVLDINLNASFFISSIIIKNMIENKTEGNILNISSISAEGNIGQSAYAASKAALNALTKTWSKELSYAKIRVNSISPGFIETNSTKSILSKNKLSQIIKNTPAGRLGKPDEIVSLIIEILKNDFINGSIFKIDGGLLL